MTGVHELQFWEDKVRWARDKRDVSLAKVEPKLQGIPETLPLSSQGLPKAILSAREIEITEKYHITELLLLLRERRISVEEVTRAFLRRAALAQTAGIGSDIGGSIRCPAAHVGIYGFKPTAKRIGTTGHRAMMVGRETIAGCPGPMSVDCEGLEIFMKVALSAKPWRLDPSLTVKEWTPYTFKHPPKVAIQWWDGVVQPHPPITRALREVAEACRKAGMTVIDWNCEALDHRKGWDILSALYWPDGGKEMIDLIEGAGEPILPLTKFILHEQSTVKELTQHELWKLCAQRDEYRAAYARAWMDTGKEDGIEVDIIICPPSFGAATPHEQSRYWGYTAHWNLLDYPGVVFPVTKVDPIKDIKDVSYVPKNDQDRFVYEMYSPEKFENAPVSLQLIGKRQNDEKVLSALAEIERAIGRE
ncbi:hypothetical protein G7Z17_g3180 [Cylindrodendrum hubeiense]|uniref:Amidase domain-containing protein n=1 Tax=Cylindrodendrum hubeiense TaxID=595255 RepID=A0A9P5LJM2_9HYPO|nr:hypothetical protein G7Z17_g3180 [Cylindrodendrum hubeiense]